MIEIYENTLLKIILRQGSDSDRKNVILESGELGYTTDTKRLYVGDGVTFGGNLAGIVFKGKANNITSLAPAEIGDMAFDEDNKKLYYLREGTGSDINDWEYIGGLYESGNNTIIINGNNQILVGKLSSGNVDFDLMGESLTLSNERITLSSSIKTDSIFPKTDTKITLFSSININNIDYNFPINPPSTNETLIFRDGTLLWEPVSSSQLATVSTLKFSNPLTATVNGVDVTGTEINLLTSGNITVGVPTLSSKVFWVDYDGTVNLEINKSPSVSVTKTNVGRYTINFGQNIGTPYPISFVQLIGTSARNAHARIVSLNNTSCNVEITPTTNAFLYEDGRIILKVEV